MRNRALWVWMGAVITGCHASRESLTAGQIGCPPGEVRTSGMGSSIGWNQSAETWRAECRGRRFICSEVTTSSLDFNGLFKDFTDSVDSDVSCHEELSTSAVSHSSHALSSGGPSGAPPAPVHSAPPTGAGGFELGMTRAAARERCEGAGHAWQAGKRARATCSGTPTSLTFPAPAELTFCGGTVCVVTLTHTPKAEWMRPFVAFQASLTEKYGPASERRLRIPSMCRTNEQFDRCAEDGALHLSLNWHWATGQRVRLSLGRRSRPLGESAVRLTYVKVTGGKALDTSAL